MLYIYVILDAYVHTYLPSCLPVHPVRHIRDRIDNYDTGKWIPIIFLYSTCIPNFLSTFWRSSRYSCWFFSGRPECFAHIQNIHCNGGSGQIECILTAIRIFEVYYNFNRNVREEFLEHLKDTDHFQCATQVAKHSDLPLGLPECTSNRLKCI